MLIDRDLGLCADFLVAPAVLVVEEHEDAHLVRGHVELEARTGGAGPEGLHISGALMGLPGKAAPGVAGEVEGLELANGVLNLGRERDLDVGGVGPESAGEHARLELETSRRRRGSAGPAGITSCTSGT